LSQSLVRACRRAPSDQSILRFRALDRAILCRIRVEIGKVPIMDRSWTWFIVPMARKTELLYGSKVPPIDFISDTDRLEANHWNASVRIPRALDLRVSFVFEPLLDFFLVLRSRTESQSSSKDRGVKRWNAADAASRSASDTRRGRRINDNADLSRVADSRD